MSELEVHEVPTGTQLFDWTIPKEWNIRAAHIKDPDGNTIVDFANSNLHVLGYSVPVARTMPLSELAQTPAHTSRPARSHPLSDQLLEGDVGLLPAAPRRPRRLPDGDYEVLINSTLADGALTYGEYLHRGASEDEFLLTAHICHPSLANDNCSGLALLTMLAEHLKGLRTRLQLPVPVLARHASAPSPGSRATRPASAASSTAS